MKVLITGNPGVGKTTIAKKFSEKFGFYYVGIKEFAISEKLVDIDTGEIKNLEVLEKKLNDLLKNKKNVIIEGHIGCEIKIDCNLVIVLRCDPEILKKRYIERKYNQKKIKENMESEGIDYCEIKTLENYERSKIRQINCTNRSLEEILNLIEKIVFNNSNEYEEVDFLEKII